MSDVSPPNSPDTAPSKPAATGAFRKLLPTETEAFRDHLLRLSRDERRMRFAHAVTDDFIATYAARMSENDAITHAYVEAGVVRAVAELRKLSTEWGDEAEAAFSVEAGWQDKGIATELMGRVIRSARNRGVRHLYMSCLAENSKMQAIARKHEASLTFEYGEVVGDIVPKTSNYFSVLAEAVDDKVGYLLAVLDLQTRMSKAA
jgi:RimJ/RimL family protein N-acetyltransferase